MSVEYPLWLPTEEWKAFLEMRKSIKAPLTKHGEKLAISKLEKLRDSGQNPVEVLNQSVFYSYRGLFEVKENTTEDNRFKDW